MRRVSHAPAGHCTGQVLALSVRVYVCVCAGIDKLVLAFCPQELVRATRDTKCTVRSVLHFTFSCAIVPLYYDIHKAVKSIDNVKFRRRACRATWVNITQHDDDQSIEYVNWMRCS